VTTSLRNFRSTLLRRDIYNAVVGMPDVSIWISGGFSGAISYAMVRCFSEF
jgi:hypothetical protein